VRQFGRIYPLEQACPRSRQFQGRETDCIETTASLPVLSVGLPVSFSACAFAVGFYQARDLAPGVYVATPLHSNAITLTWAFYDGNINYNGALAVSGATGTYNVEIFSYYHSFSFFGRSANVVASLPHALGELSGNCVGCRATPLAFRPLGFDFSLLGKP
jgi:hypothetical protein